MEIVKKIAAIVVVVLGLAVLAFSFLALISKGNDKISDVLKQDISATMTGFYVSNVPHGPPSRAFHAGDELFFNIKTKRPEGCFIDTDFRFARKDAENAHTIWAVDGARVYAPPIDVEDNISQSVMIPKEVTPGQYMITRLTGWQCGSSTSPIMNIVVLPLEIRAPGKTLD
jgi:hypothetical protein